MNDFFLPAPDTVEGVKVWNPVVRVGRTIPFGYEQDPNDPDVLLPIKSELDLLELAKKHLKRYSLRNVSAWLSAESGRYISHMGLSKRVSVDRKRLKDAAVQRLLAEKYKKALEKAQKLEKIRLGSHTTAPNSVGTSETGSSGCGEGSGDHFSTESGAAN